MFLNHKEVLEKANYSVRGNEILNPQGQPVAGSDAYGQVWYKDPFGAMACCIEHSNHLFFRRTCIVHVALNITWLCVIKEP